MGEGGFVRASRYRKSSIEPPTPWSQTKNHTKLDYPPEISED